MRSGYQKEMLMIKPDFNTFDTLCSHGNLIPIVMEIPGDMDTPLSAFMKIDDSRAGFLLESVEGGTRWARYSFLGSDPHSLIRIRDGIARVTAGGETTTVNGVSDAAEFVKQVMASFTPAEFDDCPEFYGGAVGFFSYDVVRGFERLPDLHRPDPGFSEACFMITRDLLIFDNFLHKIILTTMVRPDEFDSTSTAYADGCARLERLRSKLDAPAPPLCSAPDPDGSTFVSNMSQEQFENMVLEAKDHIKAGDIIQVVLSQRFQGNFNHDPLSIYRGLRTINPSPYMFFIKADDEVLAGSSPEVMVRLRNGEAVVRPIAGTRPRAKAPEADAALEEDLLKDSKELAEHVMLVDLARNDLGRIAKPGTVVVDAFKTVEKYSHVMHMVSNVKAIPAEGYDAYDLLRATFPAGTLSGAPKIRAMEIIEDLEPDRRGPYGGCVGYFSYSGSMDMGITIRTVMLKGANAYFQAGAGIVADSVPEREFEETIKKAEAMKRALAIAKTFPGRRK